MICVSLKCVIILLFKLIFAYGVHIAPGHPTFFSETRVQVRPVDGFLRAIAH